MKDWPCKTAISRIFQESWGILPTELLFACPLSSVVEGVGRLHLNDIKAGVIMALVELSDLT